MGACPPLYWKSKPKFGIGPVSKTGQWMNNLLWGFESALFRQGDNMTEDELIKAARERVVTRADIKAFKQRLREVEEEFGDMSGRVSNEWLNREYNI